MSDPGLTPTALKQQHAAEIARSETFRTQGVSEQAARNYLTTPEGKLYLRSVVEADPGASKIDLLKRAVGQITSGSELPRMEAIKEPLVKIVPAGQSVSQYSPFFTKQSEFDRALASGKNLSEYFGLPITSEAQVYDVYQIQPKASAEVFVNRVAPTSELGGLVTKSGGAEQYLVPNRALYTNAVRITSIGNDLALHNQLVVAKGLGAPIASVGEAAIGGEIAGASKGLRPGMLTKGATAVAVAAVAYDFVTTGHQVLKLEAQGNATGAASAKTHFIGRNVGGIGGGIAVGFLSGAGYGLVAGSETGPGALVTGAIGGVAGGVGGAFLGEKWAKQKDIERVFTQKDKDGNEWHRDPADAKGTWTRMAETQQVKANTTVSAKGVAPVFGKVQYVAGDVLANELNYKSANASYELGLANLATPQDPYSIPPGKGDSKGISSENWTRNAQTHAWTRTVTTEVLEHGITIKHGETASPQRAAELDQASRLIIAQNAANTPAAVAARYQVAYNEFGWNRNGEVPPAVKDASAKTDVLQASDGNTYTRGGNGEWTTPGMVYGTNQASGNVRDELNAVHQSQQSGLQEYSRLAAEALANPTLPKPMTMRGMVAGAYASAGVARTDVEIDAATAAVASTHARTGIDQGGHPYSLVLQPDPKTGRAGPNSAIVTLMDDGRDGFMSESKMVPKAITTAEEIRQAGKIGKPETHAQLSPNDQGMFEKIRNNSPARISDDHVGLAMLLAKKDGMTDSGKIGTVKAFDDTLWVMGATPGFRVSVNGNEPAPPLKDTAQEAKALDQQQQLAQNTAQRNQEMPGRSGLPA